MNGTARLKQDHVDAVRWALHAAHSASIRTLAGTTGLSFATVAGIMAELVQTGEAVQGDVLPSGGGRRAQGYRFNPAHAQVLAVSAQARGSQNVIFAQVRDLYGETVYQTELVLDTFTPSDFETVVDRCRAACPDIWVLALALPGVVHEGCAVTNDYPALVGVDFQKRLEAKYRLPTLIENDVNAAIVCHALPGGIVAGLYFPQRFWPGGAVCVNGIVLHGAAGYAGEVGLLPLGIDWLALNYTSPAAAGAVATALCTFCGLLNPDLLVLYGDFFTPAMRQATQAAAQQCAAGALLPPLLYRDVLREDIFAGLFAKALQTYRAALHHPYPFTPETTKLSGE